jgi:hypothetical protein
MSGWTTFGIYFNKDIFDNAKMEYPPDKWTWEQLGDMSQKLTGDTNGDGKSDVWGWCHWQLNSLHTWTPVLYAYGGEHFSQDGNKAILNEPGGVAALDFMQRMWTQRKAVPAPADVAQMGGWSSVFMAGIVGISQIYSAFHDTVYKSSKGKFEWRIGRIPEGPAGRFMPALGAGWSIPSTARIPDVAWDWARHQVSHLPTVRAVAAGTFSPESIDVLCRVANGHGLTVVARVPSLDGRSVAGSRCPDDRRAARRDRRPGTRARLLHRRARAESDAFRPVAALHGRGNLLDAANPGRFPGSPAVLRARRRHERAQGLSDRPSICADCTTSTSWPPSQRGWLNEPMHGANFPAIGAPKRAGPNVHVQVT